jgi:hypothetical protein
MKHFSKHTLLAALVFTSPLLFAEKSPHTQEAIQHLEQASESAKTGDVAGAAQHTQQAKQHAIQHEMKHPFHKSTDTSQGEQARRQHADEAFENMNKAKASAVKGDKAGVIEATGNAEKHLKHEDTGK